MFRLFLAVLFASAFGGRSARVLAAELDAVPAGIETLYDAGQYRQATEALQAAVAQNPTNPSLFYWLGRCYYEMRDFDRSISNWERAVALDPNRFEYHDWLGRACGRKADEDSHSKMASALSLARRTHHEFEAAVRLDTTNVNVQRDLIAFVTNAPANLGGGEEHALDQIHALSDVDPVEGDLALADLYTVHKKFDQASEEYQKVLKSTTNRIEVYFEVADYYRDQDDPEHMRQAIGAAEKIASSDRRLSYYHGVVLVLEKNDLEVAEKGLRIYIDSVPDNSKLHAQSSAYEWLGKLYENENKRNLAAEQYKAALTLDPQNKTLREAWKRLPKK